jgi:hypothetical protein
MPLSALLPTIKDEKDLPDGWVLTFLNLRGAELHIDGCFSPSSTNLLALLNNITCVLDAVLRTPSEQQFKELVHRDG